MRHANMSRGFKLPEFPREVEPFQCFWWFWPCSTAVDGGVLGWHWAVDIVCSVQNKQKVIRLFFFAMAAPVIVTPGVRRGGLSLPTSLRRTVILIYHIQSYKEECNKSVSLHSTSIWKSSRQPTHGAQEPATDLQQVKGTTALWERRDRTKTVELWVK